MLPTPAVSLSSAAAETPAVCRVVRDPAELAQHLAVRRRVFVEEQRIFAGSDRDEHDDDPATLHVLALWGDRPAGAVRLYPLGDRREGEWKGDRLAVLPGFREHRLGEILVRFAVRTAGERGGARMIAHVQLPNVAFFERLGWRPVGQPAPYAGLPHQLMDIPLSE
jgi:putative N-acetyltransferase (TIGR04045 family)